MKPLVVGKAKGARREADAFIAAAFGQGHPQAEQQFGELVPAPIHPGPVAEIRWGVLAGFAAVELAGELVVAQLHRPGEMVIELDAIGVATASDLRDQPHKPLLHTWMGRIQPHPQIVERRGFQVGAMHGVER